MCGFANKTTRSLSPGAKRYPRLNDGWGKALALVGPCSLLSLQCLLSALFSARNWSIISTPFRVAHPRM